MLTLFTNHAGRTQELASIAGPVCEVAVGTHHCIRLLGFHVTPLTIQSPRVSVRFGQKGIELLLSMRNCAVMRYRIVPRNGFAVDVSFVSLGKQHVKLLSFDDLAVLISGEQLCIYRQESLLVSVVQAGKRGFESVVHFCRAQFVCA
jgi:hypothetical protein